MPVGEGRIGSHKRISGPSGVAQQAGQDIRAGQHRHDIRAAVLRPVRNGMIPSVVMTGSFDAWRFLMAPG